MIGERFRQLLDGRSQKEIALEWWERWRERTNDELSRETVPSRLSELLNDRPSGLRFFFIDGNRADLLMHILDVSEAERAELMESGRIAAESGRERLPRVVVDLTTWDGDRETVDALFLAVEKRLVPKGVLPMVMVITGDQYRYLPRTFDDLEPQVRIERVADEEAGWSRVVELANDHAVVVSARRYPVFHRWVAARYQRRRAGEESLMLEPSDGLETLARNQTLPLLPIVEHPLADLGIAAAAYECRLPDDAVKLRQLIVALADESAAEALQLRASQRLRLAQQLHVRATSTAAERRDADMEAAAAEQDLEIRNSSQDELDKLLARAHRRPEEPAALRVGDKLHLLNPTASVGERIHADIEVHRIECARPALTRLLEAAEGWTVEQWLDDPYLDGHIARLDPQGTERIAFWHARATLLLSGTFTPSPAPVRSDWRAVLGELVSGAPPAALLRLSCTDEGKTPFLLRNSTTGELATLALVPPIGDVLVSRDDAPVQVMSSVWYKPDWRRYGYVDGHASNALGFACLQRPLAKDMDFWLDLVEASPFAGGSYEQLTKHTHREAIVGLSPNLPEILPLDVPQWLWDQADRELALAWWALQRAVVSAPNLTMHDGAGMLMLGHQGIFAEVRVHECPEVDGENVRAALLQPLKPVDRHSTTLGCAPLLDQVNTHRALTHGYGEATTHTGHALPRALHLRGQTTSATIVFRSSPLFGSQASPAGIQPSAAAAAENLDARRRDDDDD